MEKNAKIVFNGRQADKILNLVSSANNFVQ